MALNGEKYVKLANNYQALVKIAATKYMKTENVMLYTWT